VIFTPGLNIFTEKIKGLLQILFSSSFFIIVINLTQRKGIDRINIIVKYSLFLVLTLAFLEIIGIIRPLSDAFRNLVFSNDILYANDRRDIQLIGHIRPKIFTSEPSHAAKIFLALAVSYSLLQKKKFYLKTLSIHIVGMYIFGSPIVLASLFLSIYLKEFHELKFSTRILKYFVLLFLFFLALIIWGDILFPGIYDRFSKAIISGGDGSVQQRIIFPYFTAYEVWKAGLPFGVGISGKEIVHNYSTLIQGGIEMLKALGNNAIAHSAIYFGIIGTPLFFILIGKFIRKFGHINNLSLIIIFFICGNIMGGLETPRFWVLVGIIFAVYFKVHNSSVLPFEKITLRNDRLSKN